MSIPAEPLIGDELLEALTRALVALHKRYYGREPASARSVLMGDEVLACVMGGVYTDVEKTMIELDRQTVVHETRSAFQAAMRHRVVAEVERLCGREVIAFSSSHHVGPDLEIQLFVLEPATTDTALESSPSY